MNDPPKRTLRSAVVTAVLVLLLPVLYCLSVGPAWWAMMQGYLSEEAVSRMYSPLWNAADFCGLAGWLNWYVTLAMRLLP